MSDLSTKLSNSLCSNTCESPATMVLNLIETADLDADEMSELRRLINRKAKELQK